MIDISPDRPVSTAQIADQWAAAHLLELFQQAADEFLALPEPPQLVTVRMILSALDRPRSYQDERNELIQKTLLWWTYTTAKARQQERVEDYIYRCAYKGQGRGFKAAQAAALAGDRGALLDIVTLFQDAGYKEPFLQLVKRRLATDPSWNRLHKKAINRKQSRSPHSRTNCRRLLFLCLNIELVEEHASGELTTDELMDILAHWGLPAQSRTTFLKWLRRSFRDFYPCAQPADRFNRKT